MSNDTTSYFDQLPVEILFRIFENLDIFTLFLSLRHTCRRFRMIINNYDRSVLDFTLMSKAHFELLLRLINPRNVVALTLSHRTETLDAVNIFCSHFRRRPFDRLHSLTLNNIGESQLSSIFKCVETDLLTSLTVNIERSGYCRAKSTAETLSTQIANKSLRRLELQIQNDRADLIRWPITSMIHQLKITASLTLDQLSTILLSSPHLQTLTIDNFQKDAHVDQKKINDCLSNFRQLTSLTVEKLAVNIADLEYLLSLTSSLLYLKLIGNGNYRDGNRWEQFIQVNLPALQNFQFFFTERLNSTTSTDALAIIASFQTPFWLDHKKWYTRYERTPDVWGGFKVELYSLPICVNTYTYYLESQRNWISSVSSSNPTWMDKINKLKLHLKKTKSSDHEEQVSR